MNFMEKYLAATSTEKKLNLDANSQGDVNSQGAVLEVNYEKDALTRNLDKVNTTAPNKGMKNVLEITSHAVRHSTTKGRKSISSFSRLGGDVDDFSTMDMSFYDEVTVAEETVIEEEVEEEVLEEEDEVEVEDEDYAYEGSHHSSSRRRGTMQRFPSRESSTGTDSMYDEETVASASLERSESERSTISSMSFYDEVTIGEETVTEEVSVIQGTFDNYPSGDGDSSDGNNSDLDSDDGIEEDEEEEERVDSSEGFILNLPRHSTDRERMSDITLTDSEKMSLSEDMELQFDDDVPYVPGVGEEGYCSQFKEGNFRSSLIPRAPRAQRGTTKKFPAFQMSVPTISAKPVTSTIKKISRRPVMNAVKKISPNQVTNTVKKITPRPVTSVLKKISPKQVAPRVSIMKQFANKPLPALTEVSARKERGGKKKKKQSFAAVGGQKKELFLFWERRQSAAADAAAAASTAPRARAKSSIQ